MTKIYENISLQICTKRRYSKKGGVLLSYADERWALGSVAKIRYLLASCILLHICICNIAICICNIPYYSILVYATLDIVPSMYKLRTHCKYVFVRCPCQWSILCIGIGPAIPYLQMCYFWTYVCTYINHRWWTIINPNLLTKHYWTTHR